MEVHLFGSLNRSENETLKYYRTMNEVKSIQETTKKAWSIGVVIIGFLLIVTSPIVNIVWVILVVIEFISRIINNAILSEKWKILVERVFKNVL